MTIRRTIPWAIGFGLIAISLVGANFLIEKDSPPNELNPGANPGVNVALPATDAKSSGGVTVLGVVAAEPGECPVGPPTVAPIAMVREVLVHEGDLVSQGQPLVIFDDSLLKPKIEQAKAELAAAREDLSRAEAQKRIHPYTLAGQQVMIETTAKSLKEAQEALAVGRAQFERILASTRDVSTGRSLSEEEKQRERNENLELRKAQALIIELEGKLKGEQLKLTALQLAPIEEDIRAASAKIARLEATVVEAEAAVAACTIRAVQAGIVEQIHAVPGQVYTPTSRSPVLWLIPNGKRIIRAEVEPEFAARILGKEGKPVTIIDANHFNVTYEGKIRRVGTAFLAKRSQLDQLTMNSTKAIECLIDVLDPAPTNRPTLRVGQPVRVQIP